MFILDQKIKRVIKISLMIVCVLFLWGVFNLFTDGNSTNHKMQTPMRMDMIDEDMMDYGELNSAPMEDLKSAPVKVGKMMADKNDGVATSVETEVKNVDKKIIKNGSLNLQVSEVEKAVRVISKIVKERGGEIFSTNFYERIKGQKSGNITIKVPVNKFEETILEIKKIATQVISESTTGQDVTAQYSDLKIQLKNKQAEEESFVKILDQAGKIDDVLAVTKQIARVRGEIERLQGRIKFMESQTEMSTITVNLREDVVVSDVGDNWRPWQVVKKSFAELVNNIQDFADGIIRFIIVGIPSLLPFALFVGIVYWLGKKVYRKMKNM